jgi:hypothetical protein
MVFQNREQTMKSVLSLMVLLILSPVLPANNTGSRMLRIKAELSGMKGQKNAQQADMSTQKSTPLPTRVTNTAQQPPQAKKDEEYEQRLFSLLEKCQLIGAHLEDHGEKADKARKLYGEHCFQVLDAMVIEQELDVFYLLQAKYLSFNGRHAEAGRYITQNYQLNPHDFETNHIFIRNLFELGQADIARELYSFFMQNEAHTLTPTQTESLRSIEKMLDSQKTDRMTKVFQN